MIRRELKVNFKSFLVWTMILLILFLMVFLIYPSISNGENAKLMNEMMQVFPPEVLKAFNMDIASMDTVYGWLKSEGYIFILLVIGCYSSVLGSNILLKEENDKTIEYLNSLPIKRKSIISSKVIVSLIYITFMIVILALFNFVGLELSGDFDKKQYILLSITPCFSCYCIFFVCLFLSTFTHKTKKMLGVSLGIVFVSYMLQVFSQLSDSVDFLKYFSLFTLSDIRNVILNNSINPATIICSIFISVLLLSITLCRYKRKELV